MKYHIYFKNQPSTSFDIIEAQGFEQKDNFINFYLWIKIPVIGDERTNIATYNSENIAKIVNVNNNAEEIRKIREMKLMRLKNETFLKKIFKLLWLKK